MDLRSLPAAMLVAREHETPDNKAPLIRALAALLIVIALLAATVRIATRTITIARLKADDFLVITATAFAVVQSALVIAQGANGLGKRDGLTSDQVSYILKSHYASDALYIAALLFAKLSATRSIWVMAPRERRRWIMITEIAIGLWALSTIVTSFFQCALPEPWDYVDGGKCSNRTAFWIYVDGLNILTDLSLTAILTEMFLKLKTSISKKIMVIGVFGCRIFVIPPIVCHMYYYKQAVESSNPVFAMWPPTVIVQVIQCMMLLVTCIPFLKPFMDSLESGQMAAGDLRGTRSKGTNSRSGSGYPRSGPLSRSRYNNTAASQGATPAMPSNASQAYEMVDLDKPQGKSGDTPLVTTVTTAETHSRETNGSWDGQSHTSQTVLVETTWAVNYEGESRHSTAN
ncbi:uncharacterized protein F5Z01DRAFT_695663 [Emericellopsis atlantica]|uniref:Rhodopsin domain-containing protein n=1 Tax=Emericellopsis atlantica TaxID=2614577 RepID=A0A9P8CK91_9HYPO|nr:uncharacterized protein F5Z01DRAFT_695663 [Emericellopsis atlantica]KAG9250108.1 hypothetical protein F5Z01DRAFT_695663 [Emericellopsis atlantica]